MIQQTIIPSSNPGLLASASTTLAPVVAAIFDSRARRENLHCTYCKRKGHTKAECCKLNGFPPAFKFKNFRPYSKNYGNTP